MFQQAPTQIQLSRLSSTTAQVDEYSRRQNEAISKEANERIQRIISATQVAQDELLRDASARSLEIEGEYAVKLKAFLQQLDASKAGNLAALEKDLNFRQEQLLSGARDEMDAIHAAATSAKIRAMNEADAAIHRDVDLLTEQVKNLGEAEVERRMNSKTTTDSCFLETLAQLTGSTFFDMWLLPNCEWFGLCVCGCGCRIRVARSSRRAAELAEEERRIESQSGFGFQTTDRCRDESHPSSSNTRVA